MNASWRGTLKSDFFASIVVFLVALPLCMGIAIACGVPVAAGLITGIVGGILVGAIAGCPLQVSGPAAGLIVLVYEIVQRFGLEALGMVVLLAGLIQVVAGVLHLGQWFRAVSPAVIKGMLAGIGILIFASQFHVMVDDRPKGSGLENLATLPQAVWKAFSPTDFHNRELRQFRADSLRTVGELHRQQAHVHQITDTLGDSDAVVPESVAQQQEAVAQQLAVLADQLRKYEARTDHNERAQAIRESAVAAETHSQAAMMALRDGDLATALQSQQDATEDLEILLGRLKNHSFAAILGILTIAVILVWQLAPGRSRIIPSPLIAVVIATTVAALFALPVFYVEVPSNLWDEITFPTRSVFEDVPWRELVEFAFVIAIVASAETLLCATAVDQMHNGQRTKYDRELCAQGVGNIVCGFLGALPMTGVIVRSSANVNAGGKSRFSAMLHGVWLLVFVSGLAFVLRMIPTACLAAILVYTGYKLVDIKSIKALWKYGWGEVAIYAATVVTIVATNLLEGVLLGVALAAVKLLYTFSQLDVRLESAPGSRVIVLHIAGSATFLRLPRLACELERVPSGAELHVDFERLDYIDHACLDLLMNWAKQHEATGGKLVIDWDSLHASFRRETTGAKPKPAKQVA